MGGWREVLEGVRKLAWGRLTGPQRALLALVRPVPDADYPLDEVLRLDEAGRAELQALLRRHGLGGWAHKVYRDAGVRLPDDLSAPLRITHSANTAHGILALSAYERLSGVLSAAGVDHIPLKGIRLLETLYPDPGTRQLSDLDVLVREEDVDRADGALRAVGYRGEEPGMWRRQGRYAHHHSYDAPSPIAFHIEVHWRLSSAFGLRRRPSWLWEEARRVGGGQGSREFALRPDVEFHGLVLHAANHAYQLSLKWLLDLRLLLEQSGAGSAASALADRAAGSGAAGACALVLGLVREVGGAATAEGLRAACLARTPWSRRGVVRALAAPEVFLERAEWLGKRWPHYGLTVWLADDLRDRVLVAAANVRYKMDLEGLV